MVEPGRIVRKAFRQDDNSQNMSHQVADEHDHKIELSSRKRNPVKVQSILIFNR